MRRLIRHSPLNYTAAPRRDLVSVGVGENVVEAIQSFTAMARCDWCPTASVHGTAQTSYENRGREGTVLGASPGPINKVSGSIRVRRKHKLGS